MASTESKDWEGDEIPYHLQRNLQQLAVDLAAMAGNKLPPERAGQARRGIRVAWERGEFSYQAEMTKRNEKFSPLFPRRVNFWEKGQKGRIDIDFNDEAGIKKISLTGTHLSLLGNLIPPDTISCSISLENLDFADPQGIKVQVSRKKFSLPSFRHGDEDTPLFIKARELLFLIKTVQARLAPAE